MTVAGKSRATERVVDFLGDLGSRWGLPAQACRVHGYLYLSARPFAEAELSAKLNLSESALCEALAWLAEYRLIERTRSDTWRTDSDPWGLMMRALEERRRLHRHALVYFLLRPHPRTAGLDGRRRRDPGAQRSADGNTDHGRKLALQSPCLPEFRTAWPLSRPDRPRLAFHPVAAMARAGVEREGSSESSSAPRHQPGDTAGPDCYRARPSAFVARPELNDGTDRR